MIFILLVYPIYKGARELFWVQNSRYAIDKTLQINLRIDAGIFGFQDFENEKVLIISNSRTKQKLRICYVSLEPELYFYIDTLNAAKILSVVDKYAGKNVYDYSTLKLISSQNCLDYFGGCGGLDAESFAALGMPDLVYADGSFHK